MGYPGKTGAKAPVAARTAKPARTARVAAAESDVAALPSSEIDDHRQAVVMRLKRVEGQIRGVLAMIDAQAPCDAVAQQLAAARKALDRAFYEMMACDIEREIGGGPDASGLGRRLVEKTRLLAKYA
jgi:DNA-binding FrmR family transcriptional regulator